MPLPTGPAVVFLFTDIEGSTRFERAVGSAKWADVVARHDGLLRSAIEAHEGVVVKTEGDAFFAAFASPVAAAAAAVAAQRAIAAEPWATDDPIRIRMGLHLGEGRLRAGQNPDDPEDYVGIDVNYTARISAAGNGGQIVLSDALFAALPVTLAGLAGLDDVTLVDEGARAVKDFDEPARLRRLVVPGAADDPRPLRTIEAPTNLPGEVTALIGRDAEIDMVREAVEASRIVTLIGPGGSGKTRLALGVARDIRASFPNGVWFIDLAAVRDPALIETAIAATIDVRESKDRTIREALSTYLRERTALLVLDNLEQLLPDGAEVVARLVRSAPNLRVVVTSRELLRIAGERGYPVPPLDAEAGVALFIDRARSQRPDLVLAADALVAVRAICERLGGLPLAIELAAARIRLLSPKQILERLGRSLDLAGGARDLPERQRTLRGAIAWSHDLLADEERRLFARLGVFAGGWTPEAAYSVADPDGRLGIDVADGLESLADKSLIRIEPGGADPRWPEAETRFSLHPLLREYALERLGGSGELEAVEDRFSAVCVEIAETAGAGILGQAGEKNLRRLDREDRNLHDALEWSLVNDEADPGLRIMGATWRWFQQRGRLREGLALATRLLATPTQGDPRIRIGGLAAVGGLAYWTNDFPVANAAYEERLALAEGTADSILIADAHYDLGFMAMVAKDGDALRQHEEQALDLYLAAGRPEAAVRARQALVLGVFLAGDYERASELELQNLAAFQASGSQFQIADSSTLLSAVAWRTGDMPGAWRWASEGLALFSRIDSATGVARALTMAAIILLTDGQPELGATITGTVYRLVREQGVMLAPVEVLHLPDPGHLAVETLGAERAAELIAAGDPMSLADALAQVEAAAAARTAASTD
jgi:predicted ATPase/class 3 adenylate cyclase